MSTTEARASVDRAAEYVARLAHDPGTVPAELQALTAIVSALESLLVLAEGLAEGLRTLDAMRLEVSP